MHAGVLPTPFPPRALVIVQASFDVVLCKQERHADSSQEEQRTRHEIDDDRPTTLTASVILEKMADSLDL